MNLMYPEAKKLAKSYVEQQVSVMQEYAKAKYGLTGFVLDVEVKFNTYKSWGGTHHGGIPFVSIGLQSVIDAVVHDGHWDFPEYPSFAFDKVIGAIPNAHWTKYISALVAHEIAHAIQFFNPLKAVDKLFASRGDLTPSELRGHKKLWKNIYKDLRVQFVNSSVPVAKEAKPVAKPVATTVAKEVKPVLKTISKKEWTTKEFREDGGLIVEYIHIASGTLILKVLNRQNKNISIFNPRTNKFEDSGTKSRVEVRNKFVETFVY